MSKSYRTIPKPRNFEAVPLVADEILAEARRQARTRKAPQGYQMRVLDDGSVFFRNTDTPGFERLISFADIVKASRRDFWISPHRSLWQHVLNMWI